MARPVRRPEVSPPGAIETRLKDGSRIATLPDAATTDDIIGEVKEIADSIKQVADQLAKSIGTEQGGTNIKAILENLAQATDGGAQRLRPGLVRHLHQPQAEAFHLASVGRAPDEARQPVGDLRRAGRPEQQEVLDEAPAVIGQADIVDVVAQA